MLKKVLKMLTPPILLELYRKPSREQEYGFFGNYNSWEEALAQTTGYEAEEIFTKVKDSLIKVRDGQAVYERDSVLFDEIEHFYPLLTGLLIVACNNNGTLNIIDYGGSLGSSYFQNRQVLKAGVTKLKWNIIEQKHFVECGKQEFENDELKFYYTIEDCLKENEVNVILLSSFLQYLEDPMNFIKRVLEYDIPYIILDRTIFIETDNNKNILSVQKVDPKIYNASYPVWFFNKKGLLDILSEKYDTIFEFDCLDQHKLNGFNTSGKGIVLKRK